MDVLSDVLAVLRTGRPQSMLLGHDAPWGQEFAEVPGAMGFQVILRGECWLLPPGGSEPVRLSPGDVVFRPHGRAHALVSAPGIVPEPCSAPVARPAGQEIVTLCGAYEIDPVRTHPLVHDLPEWIHLAPTDELRSAVSLLTAELEQPRLGTGAAVPALLEMLLLYLLRCWYAGQPAATTGWVAALNDPVTSAALHAMHEQPGEPWTVASLAARAGLSRAPFARRFTALVGRPPLGYLTWWRMTVAARLLRSSDATVATVAHRVGYASEFAFATAFRRHHGTAPGRYRRGLLAAGAARELVDRDR
ncbi:AraC family transcriptional regulator [Actinoplanes friuliensis]|uniref:AraC family transcriptional regulator n=1 Tax=Actinoplanes friuliensis DSM 7358 TaxID=1246995 RepID=U5VT35_9ACTN|nr:AraC family transcriptional regulator [Actinoplanes friuliensis]AGZ40024.1 AraC family transcriptional regulator [Actinoplanes friuliensis DSM 7358]